jgi:uncharacterized protein
MPERWAYFDTSALVKRYVKEDGTLHALRLIRRHRILTSAITPLETVSALSRRRNSGELAERDFLAILSTMRKDRTRWELVEISPLVLSQAEKLIQKTTLKTLDALHIASAIAFHAASGISIPFITWDKRQRTAAEQLQLELVRT